MLKCPVCSADLAKLDLFPDACPGCGYRLTRPGAESASVQLISDSGEPRNAELDATVQSDEASLLPAGGLSENADDDPNNSKTFVSDEWDDPVAQKEGGSHNSGSGESAGAQIGESASLQLISDSGESRQAELEATLQSNEASLLPSSGVSENSDDNPNNSKTCISDEWDDPVNSQTVQSGEFDESKASASGGASQASVDKTVQFDESDDPSIVKTLQSEEFSLENAAGPGQAGADRTVISDEWDAAGGVERTLLSDSLPPDAIKTMQTNWSGAFEGKTTPGMTIKGRATGKDKGTSSLVIKERTLRSPDEQKPAGFAAEYELIKILGEGGMGVVYDAKQMSVDRSVAVKMLKGKTAGDEKQRQKFLAEAVVTGELDHPNIVPIYDVGTSDRGLLFYSMKKVKGTPWIKLVTKKPVPENLEILMKVSDAVAFAHNRGVIHRDLKPENVMLGDFGEVLVMDWGLALPAPGYAKTDTISTSHSMGGTPAYMAPEMASGPLEKISFASDIYLLGAMLYEILTGRAPHTGKNTMQCLFAAAKNEIRPPENDQSGELMDIAMQAMATDPKDRYPTVADFQQALRDYRMHIESIVLSTRAAEELENGTQAGDYNAFNRARFGFEEAIKQWSNNARAKTGLSETLIEHATWALKKGDFDLGAGLLDANNPKHHPILAKLQKAQKEREAKQRTLKILKVGAAALIGVIFLGGTGGGIWINSERVKAIAAEKNATEQKDKAVIAEQDANDQKDKAVVAKQEADDQRVKALAAKQEADNQRTQAETAKLQAEKAEKDQAYEAYIAQIGLADAKIEENAFDSAREILENCDKGLRNWEWRRLSYLCGLSEREVDAEEPIDAVAFSKDGTKFITGGWNRSAKIWETATGKLLATLPVGGLFVHSVAFSPDGRFVAIGGNDKRGFVRIWNAETGKPEPTVGEFKGTAEDELNDGVLSVAFSRDGSKLLTSSFDKTARLWDVKTGQQLKIYKGHNWFVWSAAFSPDESQIVTASQDGSVIIWNTESAKRIKQFLEHQGPVYAAAFAPDGKRVVTGGYDTKVLVWQPQDVPDFDLRRLTAGIDKTGEGKRQAQDDDDKKIEVDRVPVLPLKGHMAPVRSVSFSSDGKLVLSGSHDNSVKVWDAETGETLKTLHGHGSWVRSCAFSPDSLTVLSASHDHKAMLWNITDYKELRVLGRALQGHGDAVLAASFDQTGKSIVTASRDRTARTWNFKTGEVNRTFREGHKLLASSAAFFPDGKQLLTAAVDNTVRFWDVTSGTQIAWLDKTGRAAALALSPNGKRILTGSDDKTAKVWDAETRQIVKVLTGHNKYEVTAVAISPDEKWLLTADANGRGILWNAETFEEVHRLQSHTGKITAAVFLPDSARLLTASSDKTVAHWDVATGKEIVPLVLKHPDAVVSLALLPGRQQGGRQALTSCADGAVRLWDLDKALVVGTLAVPSKNTINAVAVSPDGRLALTVQSDEKVKVVRLWDLEVLREIKAPQGKDQWGKDQLGAFADFSDKRGIQLSTAAFSPDGESILTVGGNEARLWNRQKASELISFSPNGIVAAASFSPDASRIVTGSWDNAARVWDAKTEVPIMKLEGHQGAVNSAVYSPDGTLILTSSDDKTARLWEAETGKPVRELTGHTDRIRSAVFSADGKQILTASDDKTARLWTTETGKEAGRFEGHKFAVMSAVFSADGKKIATGSEDNTAKVWEVESRKVLQSLEAHTAPVASVAFLPDGQRVLTGSQDNTAKLWDAVTGKEVLTLKGHAREVTCVNVSKDGRYVITGSRDGTAIVWLATPTTRDELQKDELQTASRTGYSLP